MPVLPGSDSRIELGEGLALTAPGVRGRAERHAARGPGRVRAAAVAATTGVLRDGLDAAEMVTLHVVDLEVASVDRRPEEDARFRSASGEPGMVLEVPDLGDDVAQVVLAVDEHGAATWVFPADPGGADATPSPTTRGTGGTLRFHVRTTVPPSEGDAATRGLLGHVGRKVLEVIAWRVVGEVAELGARALARRFEEGRRPVRVRTFLPGEQRLATPQPFDDWQRLAAGPSLWFVHGTFSTAHGGFGALDDATLRSLHDAYDGRVVAFDHHTLHVSPAEDVEALAALVPEGLRFDADVVAHSRGGLVARRLAGEGVDHSPLRVRRAVTVATPHHGTALADPQHVSSLLDRVTTLLNLAPDGLVVADALATVLDVVRIVLAKGVASLPGLAAMDPDGDELTALNGAGQDTGIELHAVAADHEPGGALRSLVQSRTVDVVVDRIFGGAANDVVVPTDGAWRGSEGPLFPVPPERLLLFDDSRGVEHTNYFRQDEVRAALVDWLG